MPKRAKIMGKDRFSASKLPKAICPPFGDSAHLCAEGVIEKDTKGSLRIIQPIS